MKKIVKLKKGYNTYYMQNHGAHGHRECCHVKQFVSFFQVEDKADIILHNPWDQSHSYSYRESIPVLKTKCLFDSAESGNLIGQKIFIKENDVEEVSHEEFFMAVKNYYLNVLDA